jgi:hypothetical protein
MASASRNAIYDALVERLGAATFAQPVNGQSAFVTVSKRLKLWTGVDASLQPYLCVTVHKESYRNQANNLPRIRVIPAMIYIYAPTGDPADSTTSGSEVLNIIRDAIDVQMLPDDVLQNRLTLGGLVNHVIIDGEQFVDPGDLDGQALLILSASILLP